MANPIRDMIESAMNSLDGMFKAETIIGDTVTSSDGTMIVPIAKVSFGVGGGGSEFRKTDESGDNLFGGGVGAGATIKPEGFLVITNTGNVRFVSTDDESTALDKLVGYAPELVDKITAMFTNNTTKGNEQE